MKLGPFDTQQEIVVIAEVGNNHEGDFSLAREMIGLAASAGANAIKFQTIIPEHLVSANDHKRIEQLGKFQFSFDQFTQLSEVARNENIIFLSTPFDLEGARFLDSIVPAFKVSSGDNTFYPLLDFLARTGKPIIMSTGIADFDAIRQSKEYIENIWESEGICGDLALLHCTSSYPAPPGEAHLLFIRKLKELAATVGYSDHTLGIEAAVLAVALGARIIEKHFTIDKNHSDFRDHQLSADPEEFAAMVRRIRDAHRMLGDADKSTRDGEIKTSLAMRRSIVASHDLKEGQCLSLEDVTWVRPGGGIPPGGEKDLIGKHLKRPVTQGSMLLTTYFSD